MFKTLHFYFDFLSPYSYLALSQLRRIQTIYGVDVVYTPTHVLTLMGRVGNTPTSIQCTPKASYVRADLARWAEAYGVPFCVSPNIRTVDGRSLLNGAASALRSGSGEIYVRTMFDNLWGRGERLDDDAAIIASLAASGLPDADAVWAKRTRAAEDVDRNIDAAVAAGVFGAPSFIFEGKLFFGNDRIGFLEKELAA